MEHTDGRGDEGYPAAPVPAHERPWRHPSEVGAEAWRRSEPPLHIGRGLFLVTTTCCATLGAALVWATLSTHPGRISTASATAATGASETSVVESEVPTPPTYRVEDGSVRPEPAIAVPLEGGRLVLTTAHAVRGARSLELHDAAGRSEQAHVLLVDEETGLAVLSTDPDDDELGDDELDGDELDGDELAYELAAALDSGDELRFGDETVVVVRDGAISTTRWYGLHQHEGSPAVNQRGELVGLCSRAEQGMRVVLLERVDEILRRLAGG